MGRGERKGVCVGGVRGRVCVWGGVCRGRVCVERVMRGGCVGEG